MIDSETKIKLYILILLGWICFLIIRVNQLKKKINDLEQRSLEIHEYILNKIEAPREVYEKIQSNK